MIEWLLVIIIALICAAIYGFMYYLLKVQPKIDECKDNTVSLSDPIECPKLPDEDLRPKSCIDIEPKEDVITSEPKDVNDMEVSCSDKTKPVEENIDNTSLESAMRLGLKVNTNSSTVTDIIAKINEMNDLATAAFCVDKDILKSIIKKSLSDVSANNEQL